MFNTEKMDIQVNIYIFLDMLTTNNLVGIFRRQDVRPKSYGKAHGKAYGKAILNTDLECDLECNLEYQKAILNEILNGNLE